MDFEALRQDVQNVIFEFAINVDEDMSTRTVMEMTKEPADKIIVTVVNDVLRTLGQHYRTFDFKVHDYEEGTYDEPVCAVCLYAKGAQVPWHFKAVAGHKYDPENTTENGKCLYDTTGAGNYCGLGEEEHP